jgi:hypothetical protein
VKTNFENDGYKMSKNRHFETEVKFFSQNFKTLPESLKDEKENLKKNRVASIQNKSN